MNRKLEAVDPRTDAAALAIAAQIHTRDFDVMATAALRAADGVAVQRVASPDVVESLVSRAVRAESRAARAEARASAAESKLALIDAWIAQGPRA